MVDDQIIATAIEVDHGAITRIEVGITPPVSGLGRARSQPIPRTAQREKRSLWIARAGGGRHGGTASIASVARSPRNTEAGGPRQRWSDRFVIGSVVCRTVDRSDRRCPATRTGLGCSAMSLLSCRSSSSKHSRCRGARCGRVRRGWHASVPRCAAPRSGSWRGRGGARDCLTLELRSYGAADLWEMGVRLVGPTSNCAVERSIR